MGISGNFLYGNFLENLEMGILGKIGYRYSWKNSIWVFLEYFNIVISGIFGYEHFWKFWIWVFLEKMDMVILGKN